MHGSGNMRRGETDPELALFHDMQQCKKERERKSNAIHPLPQDDAHQTYFGSRSTLLQHHPVTATMASAQKSSTMGDGLFTSSSDKHGDDDLLTTELGKNDYDWLLTPPGTPMQCTRVTNGQNNSPSSQEDLLTSIQSLAAIRTSRLSSSKTQLKIKEPLRGASFLGRPDVVARKVQNGLSTTTPGMRNDGKRPSTPGSISSSRPTSPTTQPTIASSHTYGRPCTPTYRGKASSAWGSPLLNSHTISSTSTNRPKASLGHGSHPITTKAVSPSCSTTPLRRPATPQIHSHPASAAVTRTPSVSKGRPMPSRSAPSSRGSSPIARTVENLVEPPHLRLSLNSPPTVNSRVFPTKFRSGRASTITTAQPSSARSESIGGRKVCSPSTVRGKGVSYAFSKEVDRQGTCNLGLSKNSLGLGKSCDNGAASRNKIVVEKVIRHGWPLGSSSSPEATLSVMQTKNLVIKSASPGSSRLDNGGVGRNGLRRSLDLGMQQMNLIPPHSLAAGMHNSSPPLLGTTHTEKDAYRNGSSIATSRFMGLDDCIMHGFEDGHDPTYPSDLLSCLVEDARASNWLGSPSMEEYMDDGPELLQAFQQGIDKYQSYGSPLVCPHGGGGAGAASCDLCNVKMRLQMLSEKCKANFGADTQCVKPA